MTVTATPLGDDLRFRRYLAAQAVTIGGSLLLGILLPVLTYQMTGSIGWACAVATATFVPHLAGPFAAAVVERRDRRVLMVLSDLVSATALASVPISWLAGALTPWQVVGVGLVVHAACVVGSAANTSALAALVGAERTADGHSAVRNATMLVELMVPPLTGLAVVIISPAPLFALALVGMLVSALLVRGALRVLPKHDETEAAPDTLLAGFGFLHRDVPTRTMTILGIAGGAAGGAWLAVFLPWLHDSLGVQPSGDARLAVVLCCWIVGWLIATRAAPPLVRRWGAYRLTFGAAIGSLVFGLAVAGSPQWLLSVFATILWATTVSAIGQTATGHGTAKAPEYLRSKVVAAMQFAIVGVGGTLGAVLAGIVAATANPRLGLAVPAALMLAAVLIAGRSAARGRRVHPPAAQQ